ncbi:patatin-like phospholipase family protein [Fusobacterium russii]|uniref:patatin-like phospholipase family protein n=1 Tax=Fusobacterium russii TaxID=854 RepID=UPI00039D9CBC|nr:patatin-like phospholipase family protein [Fusobacterium russii]
MKKYRRAIIFAGGGNRFAVYAGMYAALLENNLAPDLIIGTCGASLSTVIISHLIEPIKIKNYFKSKELYNLSKNLKLTDERKFFKLPFYLLMKFLSLKKDNYVEDVINRFLIDFPSEIENLLPNLASEKAEIDSIIIGSKLNFSSKDINRKINEEKIYREVIFTNIKSDLNLNKILRTNSYKNSLVDEDLEIVNDLSLINASRISMADMFLMSPVIYKNNYYAGGAIDLLPFEIASLLAKEIFLELKQSYNFIENSALKLVLGYNGNNRFKEVNSMQASHWIDTSDMPFYFKENYSFLKYNFFKMELELSSLNYEDYCRDIDSQWEYGYNRVIESMKLEKNFKKHQRIKIK